MFRCGIIASSGGVSGGGEAYDDTAVLADIAALEARADTIEGDIQWNLNSAAGGSDAGPVASILIENLSATKRSRIVVKWTQSGAALTTSGIEMEPNDTAGDGDSNHVRVTNIIGTTENTSAAIVTDVNLLNSLNFLELELDPVAKIGRSRHHSGISGATAPRWGMGTQQWAAAGITSIRLNCLTASATLTGVTWTVWTENT
jgi:hypothetical protein